METKIVCKFFAAILAFAVLPFSVLCVFASEPASEISSSEEVVLETEVHTSEIPTETQNQIVSESSSEDRTDTPVIANPNDVVSVDVVRSTSPVRPADASGLKKIILQLIGDYDMVTNEYTYTSSNGYTSKQVTTEPDYAWMISAAVFALVLWSLFRFVGGLANGKR